MLWEWKNQDQTKTKSATRAPNVDGRRARIVDVRCVPAHARGAGLRRRARFAGARADVPRRSVQELGGRHPRWKASTTVGVRRRIAARARFARDEEEPRRRWADPIAANARASAWPRPSTKARNATLQRGIAATRAVRGRMLFADKNRCSQTRLSFWARPRSSTERAANVVGRRDRVVDVRCVTAHARVVGLRRRARFAGAC